MNHIQMNILGIMGPHEMPLQGTLPRLPPSTKRHATVPRWEHFSHDADIGVRGIGASCSEAFEQAALAMTAVITDPETVRPLQRKRIELSGTDPEILLSDWLNAIIYESALAHMLFSRFEVEIHGDRLTAHVTGEPVDIDRHHPAVEVKGATMTALRVTQDSNGSWIAQCVVDV